MRLKRVHLPSFGVTAILCGGFLRLLASLLVWPLSLVLISDMILLMAFSWILMFDFFPLFIPFFQTVRDRYKRRYSFFVGLLGLFAIMQIVAFFLPSGRMKDFTTTLGFISFLSGIGWAIGSYLFFTFTPIARYLRRKPKEPERISFSDVITSMAVIIIPTIALSFLFSPTGLKTTVVTPNQIFVNSILTNVFIVAYLYLFVIRRRVFTWRQLGLRRVSRENASHAFLVFLLVTVLIVVLQAFLKRLHIPLSQYSFTTKDGAQLALIATVLITPFVEELYFRGFLFRGLQLHHKPWLAYGISALLFALLHPPLLVMAEVFLIGILLAYVVQETKSIWPSVAIHAVNNALVMGYLLFT